MTGCSGLLYYLFALIALLLVSVFFNLKQRRTIKMREESEMALVKEAYFNPVSELPNRKNLDIMINEQIHRVHRRAQSFLIAVIRIKNYNDVHLRSKKTGDEFIMEAGTRIVDSVRDEDIVSHISDNSFVILFNEYLEEDNYEIIFQRLRDVFKDRYQVDEKRTLPYEVSVGRSTYPDNGTDSGVLITQAMNQALK